MKIKTSAIVYGIRYIRRFGLRTLIIRIIEKKREKDSEYQSFYLETKASLEQLEKQRMEVSHWNKKEKISIVTPLYHTPAIFLRELIESVLESSYENWQLCFADATQDGEENQIENIVKEYQKMDEKLTGKKSRICYKKLSQNYGIAENTNQALAMAEGDYIAFLDHDDIITPDALYEMALAAKCAKKTGKEANMFYSDEDKVNENRTAFFEPHFKPDFNQDLLNSNNYITHFLMVSRELLDQVGGINKEYDGAQDYDFVLRCVEQAKYIYHIPEVLYHWRSHSGSIAGGGENKEYAFEAGRKALLAHYERCGIRAEVGKDDIFGIYHTEYLLQEHPLVSIITDNSEKLKNVVENGLYKEYEYVEKEDVGKANGKYLLFLEEGIEKAKSGWLKKMVEDGAQNEIGVVGAKVMEKTGKQLHAGMILGGKGMIHYVAEKSDINDVGYMGRYVCTQEYSAVSGMCMLVERQCFEAVGGFDDELTGELQYTDLCLKIRGAGYKVMYEPGAKIYIKKSIHQNLSEEQYFSKRWHNVLEQGDMYYNKNLEIEDGLYVLKKEPRN